MVLCKPAMSVLFKNAIDHTSRDYMFGVFMLSMVGCTICGLYVVDVLRMFNNGHFHHKYYLLLKIMRLK